MLYVSCTNWNADQYKWEFGPVRVGVWTSTKWESRPVQSRSVDNYTWLFQRSCSFSSFDTSVSASARVACTFSSSTFSLVASVVRCSKVDLNFATFLSTLSSSCCSLAILASDLSKFLHYREDWKTLYRDAWLAHTYSCDSFIRPHLFH